MTIGIYISPAHSVPPNEKSILAPWVVVKNLTDGLVSRGHTVHLFCAEGSKTKGLEHAFGIQATVLQEHGMSSDAYKAFVREKEHALFFHMMQFASKNHIDCIHIHQPIESLSDAIFSAGVSIPFVFTFHDPISKDRWDVLRDIQKRTRSYFVSVSHIQQDGVPLTFAATVYHGISMTDGMFKETIPKQSPFLVAGRIIPKKGSIDAIEAIKQTDEKLIIIGQIYRYKPDLAFYFDQIIKPHIDGRQISLVGVVKPEHMTQYYQSAKALFFPVKWEEPFGLVMIEAMACGTPVIAYNRGSVPEIVKDGVTGFIIDPDPSVDGQDPSGFDGEPFGSELRADLLSRTAGGDRPGKGTWVIKKQGIDGLVEAIGRIDQINRRACRKHIEEYFTIEHMITGYEKIYEKILKEQSS
jgi:glycosyltransferase involved in cell wall biosynthesis